MDSVVAIKAVHSYTIYANKENGWTVVKYRNDDAPGYFIACGNSLPTATDSHVTLYGTWTENKQYGRQFTVSYFDEILPVTLKGFISYMNELKCGIGRTRSAAIYNKFGSAVWDVLENEPEKLLTVSPKIPKSVMDKLVLRLHDTQGERHVMSLFKGTCDISPKKAQAVIKKFKENAEGIIMCEPYRLCEVPGFTFLEVDELALKGGIDPHSKERLVAAVKCLFEAQSSRGHVCIPVENVRELLVTALSHSQAGIDVSEAGTAVNLAVMNHVIVKTGDYLYLPRRRTEEAEIAAKVIKMLCDNNAVSNIDAFLEQYRKDTGVVLADKQEEGVKMVLNHSFSILTGGPGTGKTTTLKAILYVHGLVYGNVSCPVLLAPTGKAARRMSEATGYPASTIHSAIAYVGEDDGEAVLKTHEKLSGNLFIVDEASMIDQTVTKLLLDKIPDEARVVFVGDPDQLPSVGCGNILLDMISSGIVPVTKLNVIFRQGADSPIIRNAHAINAGETELDCSSPHFKFLTAGTDEEIFNGAVQFYLRCVKYSGLDNTILLCPYRSKTALNVNVFNRELQARLNPIKQGRPTMKVHGVEFREGDRVMQLKNTDAAKNGDTGYIRRMELVPDTEDKTRYMTVAYIEWNGDGTETRYTADLMASVDLAYCTTVHKSQGSEYTTVLLICSSLHKAMLKRNVVYTGVTRAKKNVAIIGDAGALEAAIKNNSSDIRWTLLAARLRSGMKKASMDNASK